MDILIGQGEVLRAIMDLLLEILNVPRKKKGDLAWLRYGTNL